MEDDYINRYIASNKELIHSCKNSFDGQKQFYKQTDLSMNVIDFKPESFVACNIEYLFKHQNAKITYYKDNKSKNIYIPYQVSFLYNDVEYILLNNSSFDEDCKYASTKLFLEMSKHQEINKCFDYKSYYSYYNEYIDYRAKYIKNQHCKYDIETETCLFIIEYSFWNNLLLSSVNGLYYIASYDDLIMQFGLNEQSALIHFFNQGLEEERKIIFNPNIYIASNLDKLKDLVDNTNKEIKRNEAVKHYITNGFHQGLEIDSFNHFDYLANNPKRIRYLLSVNESKINWDFNKLVKSIVAEDYLKFHNSTKKRKFDHADFVKKYVSDKKINFDDNLSLKNASYYFVRAYVNHKTLRKTLTSWSKFKRFFKNRIEDTFKQVPYSITRLVVQNKFF